MIAFIDDHRNVYGVEPICRVLPIAPFTFHERVAKRQIKAALAVIQILACILTTRSTPAWVGQASMFLRALAFRVMCNRSSYEVKSASLYTT